MNLKEGPLEGGLGQLHGVKRVKHSYDVTLWWNWFLNLPMISSAVTLLLHYVLYVSCFVVRSSNHLHTADILVIPPPVEPAAKSLSAIFVDTEHFNDVNVSNSHNIIDGPVHCRETYLQQLNIIFKIMFSVYNHLNLWIWSLFYLHNEQVDFHRVCHDDSTGVQNGQSKHWLQREAPEAHPLIFPTCLEGERRWRDACKSNTLNL